MCESCHLSAADGITVNQKDDGDRSGCSLRSSGLGGGPCDDEIHVEADQVRGQAGEALGPSLAVSVFQRDVLALDPAEIAQTPPKRIIHVRRWTIAEHADSPDFRSLLRVSSERCNNETEGENDREPDQPHGHSVEGWLAGSLAGLNMGGARLRLDADHGHPIAFQGIP
jgi:hypothetical protein